MLWHIAPDDPDYLQPLLEIAQKDNPDDDRLQFQAIEILGAIGPAARGVVPKLLALIRTHSDFRREWALAALRKIDPEAARTAR
jgi:hypothetical protein